MRGVLALFFLSCVHSLVAQSTPTELLTSASVNLFNGIIKGILEENESIFEEAQMLPSCVINGVETIEIFDYVVSELFNMGNLSVSQFDTSMETLTVALQKSLLPTMGACHFNASNITAVQNGLTALSQPTSIVSYDPPILTIGGVEMYEVFAAFLGEWGFSNYHQAGYYFGLTSSKVIANATNAPTCTHVDDSDARLQRVLQKVKDSLQSFVYDDEALLIAPLWAQNWDWCTGYTNQTATKDICQNGVLGIDQYFYLGELITWQGQGFNYDAYFDQEYAFFLNDMEIRLAVDAINSNYSQYYEDLLKEVIAANTEYMVNSTYCTYDSYSQYPTMAPCWYTSILPSEWVENYQNGMYQGGIFTEIYEHEASEQFCMGGLGDVDSSLIRQMKQYGFIEAQYDGEWYPIEYNLFDDEVNVTYIAKSVSRVDVTPGDWFNNSIIAALQNYPQASAYLNSVNGSLNAIISGIVVANELLVVINSTVDVGYTQEELSGTINGTQSQNATAYRAGPFFRNGNSWTAGSSRFSLSAHLESKDYPPYILAFIIKQLPLAPSN